MRSLTAAGNANRSVPTVKSSTSPSPRIGFFSLRIASTFSDCTSARQRFTRESSFGTYDPDFLRWLHKSMRSLVEAWISRTRWFASTAQPRDSEAEVCKRLVTQLMTFGNEINSS